MKLEPSAWMYDIAKDGLNDCTNNKHAHKQWPDKSKIVPLYTLPSVLAALREVTPMMSAKGFSVDESEHDPKGVFLAMLDQFEKEQQP